MTVLAAWSRFLRVPGGCYVEGGDFLKDRFQWKCALGCTGDRPGHMNANWGYWSTDGGQHSSIHHSRSAGIDVKLFLIVLAQHAGQL